MQKIYLVILISATTTLLFGQDLERRAAMQASVIPPDNINPGVVIRSIETGSPLEQAGLLAGDRIIQIDDRKILRSEDWGSVVYRVRANQKTTLHIKRGSQWFTKSVMLKPLEKETHKGITTYYESIVSDYGVRPTNHNHHARPQ